jgi:uncharacterized protein
MSTIHHLELGETLFGKTRRAVLALLFGRSDEQFYLRQIARITGTALGAVQREVKALSRAGLIEILRSGNQVFFRANTDCAIFKEIKAIVAKTFGVSEVIRSALARAKHEIVVALVFGSIARGTEKRRSDLDLLIVGGIGYGEVVETLQEAQDALGREINPVVLTREEFQTRTKKLDPFLKRVISGEKVFVIGDSRCLEELGEERLARKTRSKRG